MAIETQKGSNESKSSKRKRLLMRLLLAVVIAMFIVFIFVILPGLSANYFCNRLKLPREIFLAQPQYFDLKATGTVGPTYKVTINGYDFFIPERYTPSSIESDSIDFTDSPRKDAAQISIHTNINIKRLKFHSLGLTKWFFPSRPDKFMGIVLNATWHPVRLMYKSMFYSSEGINTRIYTTLWKDRHHIGYVYPTTDKSGYTSKVFDQKGPGYFQFTMTDERNPITMRSWTDHALKIIPMDDIKKIPDKNAKSEYNIKNMILLAETGKDESDTLGICLSEFYRTKSPLWLIPVSKIMLNREYYPNINNLYKKYSINCQEHTKEKEHWDNIFNTALKKILKIEIDPTVKVRELNTFCKNLTRLEIENIVLKITINKDYNRTDEFSVSLGNAGCLLPYQEKNVHIKIPDNINLNSAKKINCIVTKIDFK